MASSSSESQRTVAKPARDHSGRFIVSDEQVTKSYLQETLQTALAPFATKAELAAEVAKLATKAELLEATDKLHHRFGIAVEQIGEQIRSALDGYSSIREHQAALDAQVEGRLTIQDGRIDRLDTRVLVIEQRSTGGRTALKRGRRR